MSILLVASDYSLEPYRDALIKKDPNLDVDIWPRCEKPESVTFIVAWYQPHGVLDRFPNLKVISSLGAGAEHLLCDDSIPEDVTLTRLIAPGIETQIVEYVEATLFSILRRFPHYYRQQIENNWTQLPHAQKKERTVGILGLGKLGTAVARTLTDNGWTVTGWSRSSKTIPGCTTYSGEEEKNDFLEQVNLLVNLLPLTPETEGILDLSFFKQLNRPAWIVNTGRGDHLVDEDLIYALDSGILEGAVLDVFRREPLPENHPFWNRTSIVITPHVGSFTYPDELATEILDNYKRMISGQTLRHVVDRTRGY